MSAVFTGWLVNKGALNQGVCGALAAQLFIAWKLERTSAKLLMVVAQSMLLARVSQLIWAFSRPSS